MPVPSTIADLDAVANNNSPAGSESAKGTVDDYMRAHAAFIKQVDDKVLLRAPIASPTFTGTVGGVTAAMVGAVALTGNETVAGVKTFSSSPVVPTPTTDMQASTKKYVDDLAFVASDIPAAIHAATGKTDPADDDEIGIVDSEASNVLKKLTMANLKAELLAYLTPLIGGTVLLGTLATTSESSKTLPDLDLSGYEFIYAVMDAVSTSGGYHIRCDGQQISESAGGASNTLSGFMFLSLETGVYYAGAANDQATVPSGSATSSYSGRLSYGKASTSIVFSASGGAFDAGRILVYGVR